MSEWVKAAKVEELAPGEFVLVETDETELAVFNIEGEFFCIEDLCTHDGGTLVEGELDGCQIICPRHGARFDVRTGEALTLPAVAPTPTAVPRMVHPEL